MTDTAPDTTDTCPSLSDLMTEAYNLSLVLGFGEIAPDGSLLTWRSLPTSSENEDMISAWADGLCHKYYQNVSTGHCSPQQTINFDLEKWEEQVKMEIEIMKEILARVGPGRKLTFEEMKARGYRGAWAGEFEKTT